MSLLINRRHWRSQSSDHRNHPRFRKSLFVKLYTHFYVHNSSGWMGRECLDLFVALCVFFWRITQNSTKNSATQNSTTKTISCVYYVTCLPRKTHLKGPHVRSFQPSFSSPCIGRLGGPDFPWPPLKVAGPVSAVVVRTESYKPNRIFCLIKKGILVVHDFTKHWVMSK